METPGNAESMKPGFAVLVVDDDPDVLAYIIATLRRNGFTAFAANAAAEAVSVIQRYRSQIRVLLTDVVMPNMNGPELARKLTALHPDLTVVYMSGYKDEHLTRFGPLLEGCRLLSKPFTPQELVSAVQYCAGPPETRSAGS